MALLEKEFNYYKDHQEELVARYNGKYVVIKDQRVIGAYNSHEEAYNTTQKKHTPGTFLIQLCTPGKEAYTAYIFPCQIDPELLDRWLLQ